MLMLKFVVSPLGVNTTAEVFTYIIRMALKIFSGMPYAWRIPNSYVLCISISMSGRHNLNKINNYAPKKFHNSFTVLQNNSNVRSISSPQFRESVFFLVGCQLLNSKKTCNITSSNSRHNK